MTRASAARSARAAGYCATVFVRALALVVLVPVLMYSAVLCLVGVGLLILPHELRLLRGWPTANATGWDGGRRRPRHRPGRTREGA